MPFSDSPGDRAAYNPGFFGSSRAAKHPTIDPKPFAEYGNRLYKITCFLKADKSIEVIEQVFLGSYERKRIFSISSDPTAAPTTTLIRHTLHLHDDDVMMATHHSFELDSNAREASQPVVAQGDIPIEQWQYHLTDHLKSSVLALDDEGNVLSVEGYQPYGQIDFIMNRDDKQLSLQDYHYSSEMRDQVTGLYYYGARSYAPQFGRWLSPDPAGLVDGLNLYGFVRNNPMSYWDWWGFESSADDIFKKLCSQLGKDLATDFKNGKTSLEERLTYGLTNKDHVMNKASKIYEGASGQQEKFFKNFESGYRAFSSGDDEHFQTTGVKHLLFSYFQSGGGVGNEDLKNVLSDMSSKRFKTVNTGFDEKHGKNVAEELHKIKEDLQIGGEILSQEYIKRIAGQLKNGAQHNTSIVQKGSYYLPEQDAKGPNYGHNSDPFHQARLILALNEYSQTISGCSERNKSISALERLQYLNVYTNAILNFSHSTITQIVMVNFRSVC